MSLLSIVHVERAHACLVAAAGAGVIDTPLGPFDSRARAGWESIIAQLDPVFSVDRHPKPADKVAWIFYAGATTQHLADGNKRLTTFVALSLLDAFGFRVDASVDELERFILELSTRGSDGEAAVRDAALWIDQRIVPLPAP